MALGQIYNFGTVTVTNGSATVPGSGVIWTDVIDGDTLQVGTTQAYVLSVNTALDQLTLKAPWAGTTAAGAVYMILKNSWLRYDPAITQTVLREFLTKMAGAGIIYAVTGASPDPAVGKDGDYALKTNETPWTFWLKVAGVWEEQTDPGGATDAASLAFTPAGNVSSTNVQAAIQELDSEKLAQAGGTMTGLLTLSADPSTSLQAATKQYVDAHSGGGGGGGAASNNVLINGDFRINQTGYVSAAVLAAGSYGHDQWKAGASGGDYSFTQLKSPTQITIASGKTLIQPISDVNVVGGSYVLSWTGTAQARAGVNTLTPTGAYAASPLSIAGQTAGTMMSVEFNAGTLGTVKLESGSTATPFVMRPYDQELQACRRYYFRRNFDVMAYATIGSYYNITVYHPVQMRGLPTVVSTGGASGNVSSAAWDTITVDGVRFLIQATATGLMQITATTQIVDARL